MSRNKNKANTKEEAPTEEGLNAEKSDKNSQNTSATSENMTDTEIDETSSEVSSEKESEIAPDAQEQLMTQVRDWQEKYVRLSADFDNYRKRTMREKMDMIKTAGEEIFISILPIMDDFDRAMKAMENVSDVTAVKEGIALIYTKFSDTLGQKGVKVIDAQNEEFNTDLHEAITKIPAPDESLKGKVVDVVQKGYYLHDKVIRYAKVVVGE